jgi:replicative DNA helicase
MLSSIGRIPQTRLRNGKLLDEDWPRVDSAVSMMSDAPIFIDDSGAMTPTEVRARARRLKREHGLGLIVVDYLQLMQVTGTVENRATEISEISRSLKALARELEVPVIALSQLNRSVEQRQDKRPVMSDLRECVTGDTLVCVTDGRRVPIRELVDTAPDVWSIDSEQRLTSNRADRVWKVGRRRVCRVDLASGRSIRATRDHRLLAGRGWATVGQLNVGDRLAVARRIPEPKEPARWPDRALVLLGHRVGDGSYLKPVEVFGAIRERMRACGVTTRAVAMAALRGYGGSSHFAFAPSRIVAADYARLLDAPEVARWAESDLFWDRVVAVSNDGEEDVFDLTVPGTANWLADGIVTHNSGALEQDADVILFIYREEVYDRDTPRKGIADIIVAKQRNGPTGDFRLTFLGEFTRFENLVAEAYGEGVF